jgi:hypothetical protein
VIDAFHPDDAGCEQFGVMLHVLLQFIFRARRSDNQDFLRPSERCLDQAVVVMIFGCVAVTQLPALVVQVPPAGLRVDRQLFAFVRIEVDDVSLVVVYPNYGVNVLHQEPRW